MMKDSLTKERTGYILPTLSASSCFTWFDFPGTCFYGLEVRIIEKISPSPKISKRLS